MKKEENKVDFDLSTLSLQELIELYGNITEFLKFLEEHKIILEEIWGTTIIVKIALITNDSDFVGNFGITIFSSIKNCFKPLFINIVTI